MAPRSRERLWALAWVLLLGFHDLSTQVLLTQALGGPPFQLRNGSSYTPDSFESLQDTIPEIETIQSTSFLPWLEVRSPELGPRYEILQLVHHVPSVGNSSHLVNKLKRHHQSESEVRTLDTLQEQLSSGSFVQEMMSRSNRTKGKSLSKSILRATLRRFGAKLFMKSRREKSACDVPDLYEGIFSGNENSILQVANLLFTGDCYAVSDGSNSTALTVWREDGPSLEDIIDMIGDINDLIGSLPGLPDSLDNILGIIDIILAIFSIVFDIISLVNGNLTALEVVMTSLSILNAVLVIAFTIGIMLAATGVGLVISAVAAIVGAIFELLDLILGAINANREANKFVMRLDTIMPLTPSQMERAKQSYKDGQPLDPDIEAAINQTSYNYAQVSMHFQLLQEPSLRDFETLIVPAYQSNKQVYPNNKADLSGSKAVRSVPQWAPRTALIHNYPEGWSQVREIVSCTPAASSSFYMNTYPCENAIGITDILDRSNNYTLFLLAKGEDEGRGRECCKNVFLIDKGTKFFYGGGVDDVFLVQTSELTGLIDGGVGLDLLDLNAANISQTVSVVVDLHGEVLQLNSDRTTVKSLEYVMGRASMADRIIPTWGTVLIDGRGGWTATGANRDHIEVPEAPTRPFNLFVEMSPHTTVTNNAAHGNFTYIIREENFEYDGQIRICTRTQNTSHIVSVEKLILLDSVWNVTHENDELVVVSQRKNNVLRSNTVLLQETDQYREPTLVFPNNTVLRVDAGGVVNTIYTIAKYWERAKAPMFGQTQFILSSRVGHIIGDIGNDTLFLLPNASFLRADGDLGTNRLMINDTFSPESVIHFDLEMNPQQIRIVGTDGWTGMLAGFQQIIGRSGAAEHIQVGCGETFIDSRGGVGPDDPDKVTIGTGECGEEGRVTYVRLASYTVLENYATRGSFVYFVPLSSEIQLNFGFRPNVVNHTIQFDFDVRDIRDVGIDVGGSTLTVYGQTDKVVVPITNQTETSPVLITKDGVILQASTAEAHITVVFSVSKIELPEGETYVRGVSFAKNIFIIQAPLNVSTAGVVGGGQADTFLVAGDSKDFEGKLDGGDGADRLVLTDTDEDTNSNTRSRTTQLVDMTWFKSLEEVVGRNGSSDHIRVHCSTKVVDGGGTGKGSEGSALLDVIEIPEQTGADDNECVHNTLIVVHPHTVVRHTGSGGGAVGDFQYFVQEVGNKTVEHDFSFTNGNHTVILPYSQDQIAGAGYSLERSEVLIRTYEGDEMRFRVHTSEGADGAIKPNSFLLRDTVNLAVKNVTVSPAIAATFLINSTATTFDEDDLVERKGFDFLENTFVVLQADSFELEGGRLNDTFVIGDGGASGIVSGGLGVNTLAISSEVDPNFEFNLAPLNSARGRRNRNAGDVLYKDIANILGRNGSVEIVEIECKVKVVDLGGGKDQTSQDRVTIPNLPCNYSTTVVVQDFTSVTSHAKYGNLMYVLRGSATADFTLNCADNCQATGPQSQTVVHSFGLEDSFVLVDRIKANQSDCSLRVTTSDDRSLNYRISATNMRANESTQTCLYPRLVFSDGFIFDTSGVGVSHGQFVSNKTESAEEVRQLILEYGEVATRLNITITILGANKDDLIMIGREGFDSLRSSPARRSHLVGNGGMNVLTIARDNTAVDKGRIEDVFVYCGVDPDRENVTSYEVIDMTALTRPIRAKRNGNEFYVPELEISSTSERALLMTVSDSGDHIGRVTFYNWRELVRTDGGGVFLFGELYMRLNVTEDEQGVPVPYFEPVPPKIKNDTSIIMLDPTEFEPDTNVRVAGRSLPSEHSVLQKGDDLILTDVFNLQDSAFNEKPQSFFLILKHFDPEQRKDGHKHAHTFASGVQIVFDDAVVHLDTIDDDYDIEDFETVRTELAVEIADEVFAFQCPGEGLFPDPKDCALYYRCILVGSSLRAVSLPCPSDTQFCPSTLQCDVPSSECVCDQFHF